MDRVSKKQQLAAAGISPRQAKQWEKLAAVPDDLFEQHLADKTHIPTANGVAPQSPQLAQNFKNGKTCLAPASAAPTPSARARRRARRSVSA